MGANLSTYSIVGYDPLLSEIGVAVQSRFLAVGALVPSVFSDVGAIATQARTNRNLAPLILEFIKKGQSLKTALQVAGEKDPFFDQRQLGVINTRGESIAHTGDKCLPYAGHLCGSNFSCQGNCLTGPHVLAAMKDAFQTVSGDLVEKLMAGLLAAQEAGGEKRGQQSAALVIKRSGQQCLGNTDTLIDIRVDDHIEPLKELQRLQTMHRIHYAMNYNDRYFRFDQDLADRLEELESSIHGTGKRIPLSDYRVAIEKRVMELKPSLNGVFESENINGAALEAYVDALYEAEALSLKGKD